MRDRAHQDQHALASTMTRVDDLNADTRRKAVQSVASNSADATDCALLLSVLDLHPEEGR